MITCICGQEFKNTKGNMKTAFMTWNMYLDQLNNRTLFSNYHLEFPFKYVKSFHELLEILKNIDNVSMALDELSVYFDCYQGVSKHSGTWFFKNFARQTRKRTVKLYYTAQSFGDVHRSIRVVTDKIYVLRKLHECGDECIDEFCLDQHWLEVTEAKSGISNIYEVPLSLFDMYDSDEIVEFDEIKTCS